MKKISIILISMLIGAMAFAQQPVVTPLWDHSVAGTADWSTGIPIGGDVPEWMGNTTERGMAHHDGHLYIVSRRLTPHQLLVLDAETGNLVDSIQIDTTAVRGGTFSVNDIAITPSGKILLANLATNTHTQPFTVYVMENDGMGNYDVSTLLAWHSQDTINGEEQPFRRLGDGFAFFGDVGEGENGYILVGDANAAAVEPMVYRWNVQNGEVTDTVPEVIVLQEVFPAPQEGQAPKLGITPRLYPLDNDRFWADGHSTYPALYNMQGEMLSSFSGEFHPLMAGISGVVFFTFQGHDFILTPATNHVPPAGASAGMFQLFRIPEAGAEEADSIAIFPERGLGANTNASYASPMAVDVQENRAVMFILSPNNGLAAFELTLQEDTVIVADGTWNFSTVNFNLLGTLDMATIVDGLTIWADAENFVTIDEDMQTFNELNYTHRLRLDTVGVFDLDGLPQGGVLSFELNTNSVITIVARSAVEEVGELYLAAGQADSLLMTFPVGAEINSYEYVYTGPPRTAYLYASETGIYVYNIYLDEVATSIHPIADKFEIRVYPNPASDRVYISVNKPTHVAVYNLAGSLVKSRLIESTNDFINVSDLQPGMYLIKSQFSNEFSHKLIVR
jgi:hypothetical protein